MEPRPFRESNATFTAPEGQPDVQPLAVLRGVEGGEPVLVSCWRPSWRERLSLLFYGKLWLSIRGFGMPPVRLIASGRKGLQGVTIPTGLPWRCSCGFDNPPSEIRCHDCGLYRGATPWTCDCGGRNAPSEGQCRHCGKRRPPLISSS